MSKLDHILESSTEESDIWWFYWWQRKCIHYELWRCWNDGQILWRPTLYRGNIYFCIGTIKNLKSFMHWSQYFWSILDLMIIEVISGIVFLAQLGFVHDISCIQKIYRDNSDTRTKESSPVPLKSDKSLVDW